MCIYVCLCLWQYFHRNVHLVRSKNETEHVIIEKSGILLANTDEHTNIKHSYTRFLCFSFSLSIIYRWRHEEFEGLSSHRQTVYVSALNQSDSVSVLLFFDVFCFISFVVQRHDSTIVLLIITSFVLPLGVAVVSFFRGRSDWIFFSQYFVHKKRRRWENEQVIIYKGTRDCTRGSFPSHFTSPMSRRRGHKKPHFFSKSKHKKNSPNQIQRKKIISIKNYVSVSSVGFHWIFLSTASLFFMT